MQLRFGEDSFEVTSIWDALAEFRASRKSKNDTLAIIEFSLSNHNDLKRDLRDVLFHPEALQRPSIFDVGSDQAIQLPAPQFLQPVHQPQMYLPTGSWYQDRQNYPLANLSNGQPWSSGAPNLLPNHVQSFAANYPDTSAHYDQSHAPQATFQHTVATSMNSPSILGVPTAVPIGQAFDEMPATPDHHHGVIGDEVSQEATDSQSPESASQVSVSHTNMAPPTVPLQPKSKAQAKQSQPDSASGPYIHGLCGKGFSSRSRVKKHHWGYRLDDLDTTTGCWAKYGKPNVNWNDHPSCKEGTKVLHQAKKTSRTTAKQEELQEQPKMAPPTSTLQDLSGSAPPTSILHEDHQDASQDMGFYHSQQPPSQSSFDSLLSAVNVASRIDAPQPQEPIHSVVCHLDAQAAAAENSRQYVTDWQNASTGNGEEAVAMDQHHVYSTADLGTSYPLGGFHVPLEVALPMSGGSHVHTSSMYSPRSGNWIGNHVSTFDGSTQDSRAPPDLPAPVSPDPYERSREI